MKTAMQKLKDMIERMAENGGDYDLLCVLGLIEDRFLNEEKEQIIEAVHYGQNNYSVSTKSDAEIANRYYIKTFKQ